MPDAFFKIGFDSKGQAIVEFICPTVRPMASLTAGVEIPCPCGGTDFGVTGDGLANLGRALEKARIGKERG